MKSLNKKKSNKIPTSLALSTMLAAGLAASGTAFAETKSQATTNNEANTVRAISQLNELGQNPSNNPTLQNIQTLSNDNSANPGTVADGELAQVTSVSQLSDVKPTDWAFTALQSLVERYGCIAGYNERSFRAPAAPVRGLGQKNIAQGGEISVYRGQRSLTRYEFAAGVNACLNKMNELLTAGLADKVSAEDLSALQRLQEEFAAELAGLKERVTGLEKKTAILESQQFSTTTKLAGQAIFAVSGGGGSTNGVLGSNLSAGNGLTGNLISSSGNTNATFNGRVRLDFNTSFTGEDLFVTRLEAGNGGNSALGVLGVAPNANVGNLGFASSGLDYAGVGNGVTLATLRYDFDLFKDLRVSLGTALHAYDHIDKNSFANDEAVDFSTTFFINNPLIVLINPQTGGAGAALDWNPGKGAFSLRALYLATTASSATAGNGTNRGLTGDPYQGTFEIEFAPKKGDGEKGPLAIRLQYTNASINNLTFNTGGVNVEWAFSKSIAVFGRYGFGTIDGRIGQINNNPATNNFVNKNATGKDLSPQTWMAGIAFPDLFRPGALAAIAVGQPFIEGKVGNTSQTNLELFYNFPITKNISITPDLLFIFNANNNSSNGTITVGTLRTVFSF
jgi:Carbohydrate-selective porin, OprB family/S-layer homology domain